MPGAAVAFQNTGSPVPCGVTVTNPACSPNGPSWEATAWILDQGIRCIGIDAWGLDRPAAKMGESYRAGDRHALWPSHLYGRKKEYLQIEKLANLDRLPAPVGFTVCAFPCKFEGCSAGWTRAVAIVE